jgi:predicted GNAT superfamily acetyltransferase
MEITICPVDDVESCSHFQELERLVWDTEPIDVVPNHILLTLVKNGGTLLGAFASDGPAETGGMVGGALSWLGVGIDPADPNSGPRLKVCSHMLGVLPAWQRHRVGLRLKLAQREAVLAQGLTDWITWTYDPLFRANALLNIHRLGATTATYIRNMYGELNDGINAGVPSDRCQVDWRLNSSHVLREIEPRRPTPTWDLSTMHILPTRSSRQGDLQPAEAPLLLDGRPIAVPLPDDISAIRRSDRELSLAWRYYMRTVLEESFGAGYTLVDCLHAAQHGWRYILVREY